MKLIPALQKILPKKPASYQETISWLRLSRSENLGPISFFQLLSRHGSVEAALEALPQWAQRGGRAQTLRICSVAEAEREYEAHEKFGAKLIVFSSPDYPDILKSIYDAPPLLSVKGRIELLQQKNIGIVGARNASLNGKKIAQSFARELGDQQFIVVSGLARGIDTSAHEGSLNTGTIAVLAGGVDHIYPAENKKIYEEIASQGVIVAEAPFGTLPQASYFPRRNRLISGLSLGVVIVEAAIKSGSLITARFALEQGREVFAVPGSPLDPRCHGPNQLIQQGASLIQNTQDILHVLENLSFYKQAGEMHLSKMESLCETTPEEFQRQLFQARSDLLENLSFTPTSLNDLIRHSRYSTAVITTILLELELAGRLNRHPGQQVSLRTDI